MQNLNELFSFIENLSKLDCSSIELKTKDFKLKITKDNVKKSNSVVAVQQPSKQDVLIPVSKNVEEIKEPQKEKEVVVEEAKNVYILKSPLVGTFYSRPKPDQPPFVQIGSKVNKGDIVCLIEAMKIYNEVESDVNGEIIRILVEDGKPVEYDQPLFEIKLL